MHSWKFLNFKSTDQPALYYKTSSYSKKYSFKLVDSDGFPFQDHDDDNNQDYFENQSSDANEKHKERKKARIIRSVWFNKEIDEENH